MPQRNPVEPAPPWAAAELSAALDATGFHLASLFIRTGNVMADADVLAAGAALTRPKRPGGHRMTADAPPQPEPVDAFSSAMRRHLDDLNRQFVRVAHGLANIEATLAEAIGDHLDDIGLDSIRPQNNHR